MAGDLDEIAVKAYHYLFPLVAMDVTRKVQVNAPEGAKPGTGPMNKLHHARDLLDASFKDVVRPNSDTLYTISWLDLAEGPIVVSAPDAAGRYYLLEMLDYWTDVFAAPGSRTSGTKAGDWAVVPPGWSGKLPASVGRIDAPTRYVWIIGRTKVEGPHDLEAVRKVQDGYKLTSLSIWGQPGAAAAPPPPLDPEVDLVTPVKVQIETMAPEKFWPYAVELMKDSLPHVTDWSMLQLLKRLGIEAGESFNLDKAPPAARAALLKAPEEGMAQMLRKAASPDGLVNGWRLMVENIGVFGNDYLWRATVALIGLGANAPDDAIYPMLVVDSEGNKLASPGKYELTFPEGQLPPVGAFWSITLYDADGFFSANKIDRYVIGSMNDLKAGPDGSTTIYVQHESPGADKEPNWLPAPAEGEVSLLMRLYAPKSAILNGEWKPPAAVKAA